MNVTRSTLSLARKVPFIFFLIGVSVWGKGSRETCGTYPERAREEILRSHLNTQRRELDRAFRKMAGLAIQMEPKGAARDVGQIAVLEEDAGMISRRNPFNLNQRLVRFSPAGEGYRLEVTASNYSTQEQLQGAAIDLFDDDDTRGYALNFSFPFFGQSYSRLNVNSDGNLTFLEGDAATADRSLGRLLSGLPRLAPLFADLDVTRAGRISVYSRPDRFVVTWLAVPEYSNFGVGAQNTFQLRIFPNGTIEFVYEDVNLNGAVVGISPGRLAGQSSIVSLAASSGQSFEAAIAERFTTVEELDTVTAAQRFYETHEDAYDYLVFYNAVGVSAGSGVVAYEVTVRNPRSGYGDVMVDSGAEYGSPRRLQAVLNMGPVTQYPVDPNEILPARFSSRDTPVTVLAHEAGHLFLAFASVRDPNNSTIRPMLGRQSAHWAFTFNSEASVLEGNRILDRGSGVSPRFETVAVTEQYSPFDQYLMGFRAGNEVQPLFYVDSSGINGLFPTPPQVGRSFDGIRRDVTVENIVSEVGRRIPEAAVSQRRFRFGFVLIAPKGLNLDPAWTAQLESYRARFEDFYAKAAGQRASAEASLKKSVSLSLWPAAGVVAGQSATAVLRVAGPASVERSFSLRARGALVEVPTVVSIAAGQSQASFLMKGLREGVDQIDVSPADSAFEAMEARVQVLASAKQLKLEILSGDAQLATTNVLPKPIVVKVTDANRLPYAGVRVIANAGTAGTVEPASAVSGEDGTVSFRWKPGAPPSNRIQFAIEGVAATDLSVTATALGKPFLVSATVLNAASFVAGLTPLGLQTIFGANLAGGVTVAASVPWPGRINDVEVLVNGRPQPLIYVSDAQINFYLADSIVDSDALVTVNTPLGSSGEVKVGVRQVQPGIFFDPATGNGAVLRQGEFIQVYGTGFGAVEQRAGLFYTVAPVLALINDVRAELQYAGLAPGFVGLYQVNVKVPVGTASGARLKLNVGGVDSNQVKLP